MRIRVVIDAAFEVETPEAMMQVSADLDEAVSKLRSRGTVSTSFRQWRARLADDVDAEGGTESDQTPVEVQ